MTKHYFLRKILKNITNNVFLIIVISVLTILLFGESVINKSMQKGVKNLEQRLGADLMIVPTGTKEDAENLLLEGQRSTFYFDSNVYEKLQELDGVSEITAQCFLKSLSADCCSSEVGIVFFDPKSDFLVGPWIMSEYGNAIDVNTVVVGYNVNVSDDYKIKLFGEEYKVSAQMAKTGTSLDSSVYFTFDAMPSILEKAEEKGAFLTETQKKENIISSVYINVKQGYKASDVLAQCHLLIGDDFEVVYPKELTNSMEDNLTGINRLIDFLVDATVVLLFVILFIIIMISMNQRKREIAIYRITGNSKCRVVKRLLFEILGNSVFGAFVGGLIGIIIVIPFGTFIGTMFDMPYLGPKLLETVGLFMIFIVLVTGIVFVAAIYPIVRICNMQPYIALRREAE